MNKQTYINVYRSIYDSIFSSVLRLSNLKVLEVRENRLKTLPKSLCRLTALERLDVGTNLLEIFVSCRCNRIEL
jgi:Leucine-rich repeat (LRR) protein